MLTLNQRKAKKNGLLVKDTSGRTPIQSVMRYLVQFNALCIIFLGTSLDQFLLTFALANSTASKTKPDRILPILIIDVL